MRIELGDGYEYRLVTIGEFVKVFQDDFSIMFDSPVCLMDWIKNTPGAFTDDVDADLINLLQTHIKTKYFIAEMEHG